MNYLTLYKSNGYSVSVDSCVKMHFHPPSSQRKTSVWRRLNSMGLPREITPNLTFDVTTATFPNKRTLGSESSIFVSVLGISAPSFFMGILIAYVLGFVLSDYTGLHMTGSLFDTDPFSGRHLQLKNLVLPALTLGIRPLAIIAQLTRGALLDVLDQDYIRTAYAKGLSSGVVVWKHGLRNALNPVITAITGWFAELLAGAFFVETIFGWKGIGKVTVDALEKLDFPVVMGSVLVSSFFFIVIGLLADLLYGLVDPRVRLTTSR